MSWHQHIAEDRRLVLLRILSEVPTFALNDSVLHSALERFAHHPTRDLVRDDLRWLEERGLVALEEVAGRTLVATLTERGGDVASGRSRVEGVKRPGPRRS